MTTAARSDAIRIATRISTRENPVCRSADRDGLDRTRGVFRCRRPPVMSLAQRNCEEVGQGSVGRKSEPTFEPRIQLVRSIDQCVDLRGLFSIQAGNPYSNKLRVRCDVAVASNCYTAI